MDRKSNQPLLGSPVGAKNLTDETRSYPVHRNQNCARALMFGKAPLSITEKINDSNKIDSENIQLCRKNTHDQSYLKRKQYEEEQDEKTQQTFNPVKNKKTTDDRIQTTPVSPMLTCREAAEINRTVTETDVCISSEKVSTTDNSGFNFHNSLQADWSLPCFNAVENNNISPRMPCQKIQSESNQNQIIQTVSPQNGCFTQNRDRNTTTNGLQSFSNPDIASDWCSPRRRTPHMTDHEQSMNTGQYRTNGVNQQQLLQSLQLGGCQGELMILPHVEMNQNGHLFLFQQGHVPSNVKLLPPSTIDTASQNGYLLPSSLNRVPPKPLQGSVVDVQHNSQRGMSLQLNSSGEETDAPIMEQTDDLSPQRTPYPSTLQKQVEQAKYAMRIASPIFGGSDENDPSREQHNHKERIRRARIRDACHLMRQLVPGMSDKTDKATVFEFAARYVHFLKAFVGEQYDKDFLIKYSPY